MSIQHALLTSLLEKPSTGYELASRFDRSLPETYRQIEQRDFSSPSLSTAQRLQYMVLRRGIMLEES